MTRVLPYSLKDQALQLIVVLVKCLYFITFSFGFPVNLRQCLLLLLRIHSAHLEILDFPMGGVY